MNKTLFRDKIREKIADDSLQAALDANTERRVRARIDAMESLPDWRERRQKAHAMRAGLIEHLDETLAQFISKAESNGIRVHRARDGAEATRLVLEIAGKSSSKPAGSALLFAKAKSMLSEEIHLNPALEAAGHRVVETDLGEYIVQMRGERPAHIITPAVHLRRHQVGQLFHEKLGIPYTEDVRILTDTARTRLREVFLSADVGLSGVNFGVAETGSLVLVSNEGNVRMCTSLPPVHIALMGMERLVPGLADLALCLSLLARSATGQKLSVYTQLIQRPEGGQQKHLIILDNGRSRLRNSPLKESLYCIRCGACLNACPVFRELGGHAYIGADGASSAYTGPIGSVISAGLQGENFSQLAQASTLCGACKDACPVDIDLPKLLLRVRAGQFPGLPDAGSDQRGRTRSDGFLGLGLEAYSWMAARPRLFSLVQKLAGWFSSPLPAFIPLPASTGWGLTKDLPRPARQPFRERFAGSNIQPQLAVSQPNLPQPATLPAPFVPAVDSSSAGPVEAFSRELTAIGGQVHNVTQAELPEVLTGFLLERGIERIQMGEEVSGMRREWLPQNGFKAQADYGREVQAGITGVLAGIAQTGTLVIPAGGLERPLSASLVPAIHIAVLHFQQILNSLEQVMRLPEVAAAPATVLISGPSRTADIEMTLTIGVHGPGELHVFVVDDEAIK